MKEKWTFGVGMIYLVLGLIADMCVPIYIGLMTEDISNNKSDNLPYYTVGILLIIGVRTIHFINLHFKRLEVLELGIVQLFSVSLLIKHQARLEMIIFPRLPKKMFHFLM